MDRLNRWMQSSGMRRWLILTALWFIILIVIFSAWIGVALLRGSTDRDAGAAALNLVLVVFLAIVCLIAFQRAMYRWFWHLDRRRFAGPQHESGFDPPFGSEPTQPAPRIDWPWTLRVRHLFVHLVGITTLIYSFAPYDNQRAIARFVMSSSAGRASAGSLTMLVFGYLPMTALAVAAMLLTYRQLRRRDAGLLDAAETMVFEAEVSWLFSFAAAFAVTAVLCRWVGGMILESM